MDPTPSSHFIHQPLYPCALQGQCSSLLRMMYNTKRISPKLKQILESADSDGDGKFTREEWHALSLKHPELMKPAKMAQRVVQKKTFGTRYWKKKTKFRNKQYGTQNVFQFVGCACVWCTVRDTGC